MKTETHTDPTYGVSEHYKGARGQHYARGQAKAGVLRGLLLMPKFQRWIRPRDRVLDFGCGAGGLLKALDVAEKIGVEPNPAARELAAVNGIQAVASLNDIDDGSCDVVLSNHCLEHVPYPIEALRQLHRKLRAGGRLVLAVPLDDWRVQKDCTGRDPDHHLYTWTPRLLANLLVEGGFRAVSIEVRTRAWPPRYPFWYKILPRPLFEGLCWIFSVLMRRRELVALAEPAPAIPGEPDRSTAAV